jgi:hypothetical protein
MNIPKGNPAPTPEQPINSPVELPQPIPTTQKKRGFFRSLVRKYIIDEENIGLNSAKEISQT